MSRQPCRMRPGGSRRRSPARHRKGRGRPSRRHGLRLTQDDENQEIPPSELEARMRPGRSSQAGFLGATESLAQVLNADARTLAELGVSARELAERLGELLRGALVTKQTVTSLGHYRVRIQRYKGAQNCPFAS